MYFDFLKRESLQTHFKKEKEMERGVGKLLSYKDEDKSKLMWKTQARPTFVIPELGKQTGLLYTHPGWPAGGLLHQ